MAQFPYCRTRRAHWNDVTQHACNWAGDSLIARDAHLDTLQADSGLCLLFAAGTRPSVEDVERLFAEAGQRIGKVARISSRRGMAEGWLELLASGLTFDLTGLIPGAAMPRPRARHFFGLAPQVAEGEFEAISLLPGPHIAGGEAMLPVIRIMAEVASALADGFACKVVCWQPAGCWMDSGYFARIAEGWSDGGAFPALGLTGIERTQDGGVESDGLAFFIGQELRVEARRGEGAADTVKLAVRVIDHLVRHGPLAAREELTGPDGEALLAEPSADGRFVRLWREA